MYHINIHCKPKKENIEYYEKVIGAYAVILINYKDYDGAMELAKFYVNENGWEIIEIEDEFFTFESSTDLGNDYQEYYDEVIEYGYSMIYNLYNEIDDK